MFRITRWVIIIQILIGISTAYAETCLDLYKAKPEEYPDEIALMEELETLQGKNALRLLEHFHDDESLGDYPEISNFFISYSSDYSKVFKKYDRKESARYNTGFVETATKLVLHFREKKFCKNPNRLMHLSEIKRTLFLAAPKKDVLLDTVKKELETNEQGCSTATAQETISKFVVNILPQIHLLMGKSYFASIQELLSKSKLQEALWQLEDMDDQEWADSVRDTIKATLLSSDYKIKDASHLNGATKKTILEYTNGIKAIFKQDGVDNLNYPIEVFAANANSEVAASELGHLLGLDVVPVTVKLTLSNGTVGSAQYFLSDVSPGSDSMLTQMNPSSLKMEVLDYISGNSDRQLTIPEIGDTPNRHNYLILNSTSRYVAIDNGMAFRGFSSAMETSKGIFLGHHTNGGHDYQWSESSKHSIDKMITELDPQTKDKILAITDEQINQTLKDYVQPGILKRVIKRIHNVKRVIENKRDEIEKTWKPNNQRLDALFLMNPEFKWA